MGNLTCMGFPGTTLDKVELDARTFAEWKVDMLKLDGCFSTHQEREEGEFHSCWGLQVERKRHHRNLVCVGYLTVVFPVPLT